MKIAAIVPIKHESTRVPGKNYRLMNGKPLYYYILETLSKSAHITQIIVDTDSDLITEGVKKQFPHVTIYRRPVKLHGGHVSTNALLMNIIQDMKMNEKFDFFLQTHATNPLLKSQTIDHAIGLFLEKGGVYDSLFSVKTHHTRFYNKDGQEMNHDRFNLIPTQELDPIYEENSCIYIFNHTTLLTNKSRIGKTPLLYKMSDRESQDIDWEDDFVLTEQLMKL